MRKLLINATSSVLILGLILTGCGSNNQGNSTINSSAIESASLESTPEIIDDTELTGVRGVFDSDDDSFKVDTVQIKGINRATSIPADLSETLIVQEENNIRKIRSDLGYYMEVKISTSISGGTVTYAYHLKDDLPLEQIDAMRTQLEEKYDESTEILQSALEPQIAFPYARSCGRLDGTRSSY
ncbi:hypothetical protein J2T13_001301 [Paenibacillus sp. DS2015]|uniref:hypothetical protein n=1 Tax=Paenibacillus sp. DS2015 TaxID=3373917 RepID=UPI003D23402C